MVNMISFTNCNLSFNNSFRLSMAMDRVVLPLCQPNGSSWGTRFDHHLYASFGKSQWLAILVELDKETQLCF
jgi:hypothetical protein